MCDAVRVVSRMGEIHSLRSLAEERLLFVNEEQYILGGHSGRTSTCLCEKDRVFTEKIEIDRKEIGADAEDKQRGPDGRRKSLLANGDKRTDFAEYDRVKEDSFNDKEEGFL